MTQIVKCLIILTARSSHRICQNIRVLIKIVIVVNFLNGTGWFDAITRTHLLVLVLSINALALFRLDVFTDLSYSLDQVHVVGHDLQVVSLVNLALDLEAFFKGLHRVL